jgi:hypothetical protein
LPYSSARVSKIRASGPVAQDEFYFCPKAKVDNGDYEIRLFYGDKKHKEGKIRQKNTSFPLYVPALPCD